MFLDPKDIPVLDTEHGPLRIITPTLSVIDRLAACWYHNDLQCWDQAIMICKCQEVDWAAIYDWAHEEGQQWDKVDRLYAKAGAGR